MSKTYGNRWETIDQVGEGSQSHIYRVKDLNGEFSEQCTLKRLKNFDRIERFRQEIRAGQELKHPNIAPILDFSLDTNPAYFVTKYYPGKTLTEIAPLEPLHALAIFADICDTVAYAHEKGVVHRDLKPDNIILDENEKPIILDFGICRFVDDDERLTETMEQVGSRFYIAPELEAGRSANVTFAVDSYSLGKILYFLLYGQPFSRENYTGSNSLSELLKKPQLDYITQRILDKSVVDQPDKRSSVSELKKESETVRRLIHEHFYPGKAGSRCRFCGEGTYKATNYAGLKGYERVQISSTTSAPGNEHFIECESIVCNLCGNTQWFSKTN